MKRAGGSVSGSKRGLSNRTRMSGSNSLHTELKWLLNASKEGTVTTTVGNLFKDFTSRIVKECLRRRRLGSEIT